MSTRSQHAYVDVRAQALAHPFVHKRCQSLNPAIYGLKKLKQPISRPYIFPPSHIWDVFRPYVVESISARPLGDQLLLEEFWNREALGEQMWKPVCTGCVVGVSIKGKLVEVLRETLESLPIHAA